MVIYGSVKPRHASRSQPIPLCYESGKPVIEVHGIDAPAVPLELLFYVGGEVLLVDGIVGAEGGGNEVIDHGFVAMGSVIKAEVLDK